jgi:peptide/nickel transport system substrate-binding protein
MLTRRSVLTATAALTVAPYLLSRGEAATPPHIGVMAKTMDDIISGFDPAEAYEATNWEVGGNAYRTLVTLDPNDTTKLVGDLAEKWEISPDGLTFTFTLRKDVKFASGKTLTADDVAFSLYRVVKLNKDPSFVITQFGWTPDNAEKLIHAPDSGTVVLTLPAVQAPGILLSCLSTLCGGVVEKEAVLAHETNGDLGNTWLRGHSAGAGPYRLLEWQASDHIILETNPNAAIQTHTPRLNIRHVADPATQKLLLQKGDVDIARDLGSDQLKSISGNPDYKMVSKGSLTILLAYMNMSLPQFQKPQARQAIKWAIDYDAIAANITPNLWAVWQSFLPRGTPGAILDRPFKRDVDKAKALLAEAGMADGFSFTLDHYAKWPYADIAQAIQANLADIGVKLQLLAGEHNQVVTKIRARQHQMALNQVNSDYVDANSLAQWLCANPDDSDQTKLKTAAWRTHFYDPELTKAVDAAAIELDVEKRMAIYAKMQHDFFERAPLAILLQQQNVAVENKGVSGLELGIAENYTTYAGIQKS